MARFMTTVKIIATVPGWSHPLSTIQWPIPPETPNHAHPTHHWLWWRPGKNSGQRPSKIGERVLSGTRHYQYHTARPAHSWCYSLANNPEYNKGCSVEHGTTSVTLPARHTVDVTAWPIARSIIKGAQWNTALPVSHCPPGTQLMIQPGQ